MSFVLPELPWNANSLEPHVSANTISFHYGKHHQGYVTKLNELVKVNKFIKYINIFFYKFRELLSNLKILLKLFLIHMEMHKIKLYSITLHKFGITRN